MNTLKVKNNDLYNNFCAFIFSCWILTSLDNFAFLMTFQFCLWRIWNFVTYLKFCDVSEVLWRSGWIVLIQFLQLGKWLKNLFEFGFTGLIGRPFFKNKFFFSTLYLWDYDFYDLIFSQSYKNFWLQSMLCYQQIFE